MRTSRLLDADERVVVSTRTHVKAMLLPAAALIVISAVAGYLSSYPSGNARPLLLTVIWALALLVAVRLVVRPFLRWLTTTYTITDRRVLVRSGVLSRRAHDLPLARVIEVTHEQGLVDRAFGSGTLRLADAGDRGSMRLPDLPDVHRLHVTLSDLVLRADDRHGRRGPGSDGRL